MVQKTHLNSTIELHVFVDASELAYAAVAYLRVTSGDTVHCKLIGSKSKVAPKQPLSIPRMELMAAVLGVRLATMIVSMHKFPTVKRIFWSDSNTVLSWLQADPRRYKQFVMFRVGEILEYSKISEWWYVPTKDNVADDATKWKKQFTFNMKDRWFAGPEFLLHDSSKWPKPHSKPTSTSLEDIRSHLLMLHVRSRSECCIDLKRFSTWKKLVNTVAILYKFCKRLRKVSVQLLDLTTISKNFIYSMIQYEAFKDEIAVIDD